MPMSWAARRRLIILLIVAAVVAVFMAVMLTATFYKAPSCTDGIQNQGETGIDCGGPCPYLCTAQEEAPTVLFTDVLSNGAGRTDVVASVENKNINAAALAVPYNITLYGPDQSVVRKIVGTIDLPPGATEPVFVPGVAPEGQTVTTAFLDIASTSPRWFTMATDPRVIPTVSNPTLGGSANAPYIEAELMNPGINALENVRVIVFVHGANGNVIAASETVVPNIPALGQATAMFTWSGAFSGTPVSIEVMPIVPFPSSP